MPAANLRTKGTMRHLKRSHCVQAAVCHLQLRKSHKESSEIGKRWRMPHLSHFAQLWNCRLIPPRWNQSFAAWSVQLQAEQNRIIATTTRKYSPGTSAFATRGTPADAGVFPTNAQQIHCQYAQRKLTWTQKEMIYLQKHVLAPSSLKAGTEMPLRLRAMRRNKTHCHQREKTALT